MCHFSPIIMLCFSYFHMLSESQEDTHLSLVDKDIEFLGSMLIQVSLFKKSSQEAKITLLDMVLNKGVCKFEYYPIY
jgi:hypothetical protein